MTVFSKHATLEVHFMELMMPLVSHFTKQVNKGKNANK